MTARVPVTVVVPVLNEEPHLADCLDAIAAQDGADVLEVLVVDGGSTDRSVDIANGYPNVRVIENPWRIQAVGMNLAIDQARGEIIVRVDGRSRLAPDYIRRSVESLEATGAAMVGGRMVPRGATFTQVAVAAALSRRLGAGGSAYHVGTRPGFVDIVYLGSFRTELARRMGGFREMRINEDGEFAHRLQHQGGVWFDPSIEATYLPRSTMRAVARQFFAYGRGRAATVRLHPSSLSPRQLVAPALLGGFASPWRRQVAAAYGLVLIGSAASARGRGLDRRSARRLPGVLVSMHLSWGIGFALGMITPERSLPPDAKRVGTDPRLARVDAHSFVGSDVS